MLAPIQPPASNFTVSPISETPKDTILETITPVDTIKLETPVSKIKKDSVKQ